MTGTIPAGSCPLGDPACTYEPRTGRHRHPVPVLSALGERCYCGGNSWAVRFGGALPALCLCTLCGQGFNIGQRLREAGRPVTHRMTGRQYR